MDERFHILANPIKKYRLMQQQEKKIHAELTAAVEPVLKQLVKEKDLDGLMELVQLVPDPIITRRIFMAIYRMKGVNPHEQDQF